MTDTVQHHCTRSWWKRPPVWILGIAAVLLAVVSLVGAVGRMPAIRYGVFLDQIETANVAIIFTKPMLLVFGGLVIAVLVRAMPEKGAQNAPAVLTKGAIT